MRLETDRMTSERQEIIYNAFFRDRSDGYVRIGLYFEQLERLWISLIGKLTTRRKKLFAIFSWSVEMPYYGNISVLKCVEMCFARRLLFQCHNESTSLTWIFFNFATSCLTRDSVLTYSGTFSTDMRARIHECKLLRAVSFLYNLPQPAGALCKFILA